MANIIQLLRSSVFGRRPAVGTQPVGVPYINLADKQLGVMDTSQTPQDLIGVTIFSTTANYTIGQAVNYQGQLYIANVSVTAGAWTPANWSLPVKKTGDTITGSLNITGSLAVSGSTNVTGNSAVGGSLSSYAGITICYSSSGGNSNYILSDENGTSKGVLYWDRAAENLRMFHYYTGSSVSIAPQGWVAIGFGILGRNGFTVGSYGSNCYNFYWFTGQLVAFVDNTYLGAVSVSSDYRIKKDVINLPGMWNTVKALRPIKYTHADYTPPRHKDAPDVTPSQLFMSDNIERWGFVAHELQETLLPSAATGVKDEPHTIQSPNLLPLVAALTKALQEAMVRIEALEAK